MSDWQQDQLQPGQIIGDRYKIVQLLSSGGFGTIYLAADLQSPGARKCAIKQLKNRLNLSSSQRAKERFATEAKILAKLGSHPQIPSLIDCQEEREELYLIEEFIEGTDLEAEIEAQTWQETEVIAFLEDVLPVLDFVHQQGVIHRDLKPSNLIRRQRDGKIVLIDFGTVKEMSTWLLNQGDNDPYTQAIGTLGYMAPEQHRGKPVYSSDIYSIGKIAIYALTGQHPHNIDSTIAQLNDSQKMAIATKQKISSGLGGILEKMTSHDLSQRYASIPDILQDLKPLELIGTTIKGCYQIVNYLGKGSVGDAYLARQLSPPGSPNHASFCVIKQLPLVNDSPKIETELAKEIAILKQLGNHPQIPSLLDSFREADKFYLVEEFVAGQNLQQQLKMYRCLTEPSVLKLLLDVLPVLAFIHQRGFVHLNLKPSNLIRRQQDNQIVLTDLGLVKQLVAAPLVSNSAHSREARLYLPPEQVAGKPNSSSDIYALGAIAIRCLIGKNLNDLPPHPQTGGIIWQPEVKVRVKLKNILIKMTKLDSKQRYSQAKDVLRDFQKSRRYAPANQLLIVTRYYKLFAVVSGVILAICSLIYFVRLSQASFYFQQAALKEQSQDYNLALQYYEEGLTRIPLGGKFLIKGGEARLSKALILNRMANYEEMLTTCQQLPADNISGLLCQGIALDNLGRKQEAIEVYERARELAPNNFEPWQQLGRIYTKLGDRDLAIAHLSRGIELAKDKSYLIWHDLGALYEQLGEYNLALNAYQEAVKINANYILGWLALANLHQQIHQYQIALDNYEKILAIDELNQEAWYGKGSAYEGLNNQKEALNSYERAIFIDPNNPLALEAKERILKLDFSKN